MVINRQKSALIKSIIHFFLITTYYNAEITPFQYYNKLCFYMLIRITKFLEFKFSLKRVINK